MCDSELWESLMEDVAINDKDEHNKDGTKTDWLILRSYNYSGTDYSDVKDGDYWQIFSCEENLDAAKVIEQFASTVVDSEAVFYAVRMKDIEDVLSLVVAESKWVEKE